jgi:hypothetical protein
MSQRHCRSLSRRRLRVVLSSLSCCMDRERREVTRRIFNHVGMQRLGVYVAIGGGNELIKLILAPCREGDRVDDDMLQLIRLDLHLVHVLIHTRRHPWVNAKRPKLRQRERGTVVRSIDYLHNGPFRSNDDLFRPRPSNSAIDLVPPLCSPIIASSCWSRAFVSFLFDHTPLIPVEFWQLASS